MIYAATKQQAILSIYKYHISFKHVLYSHLTQDQALWIKISFSIHYFSEPPGIIWCQGREGDADMINNLTSDSLISSEKTSGH